MKRTENQDISFWLLTIMRENNQKKYYSLILAVKVDENQLHYACNLIFTPFQKTPLFALPCMLS